MKIDVWSDMIASQNQDEIFMTRVPHRTHFKVYACQEHTADLKALFQEQLTVQSQSQKSACTILGC